LHIAADKDHVKKERESLKERPRERERERENVVLQLKRNEQNNVKKQIRISHFV
jgi:hypothetical protein